VLPADTQHFYQDKITKDHLSGVCKNCRLQQQKEWRQKTGKTYPKPKVVEPISDDLSNHLKSLVTTRTIVCKQKDVSERKITTAQKQKIDADEDHVE
jgi:hypothetical protein